MLTCITNRSTLLVKSPDWIVILELRWMKYNREVWFSFTYFAAFQFISHIHNVTDLPLYVNGTTGTLLLLDETLVGESERNVIMITIGLLSPTVSLEQYYSWFHNTFPHRIAKCAGKLGTRLWSSQLHGELDNQIVNFKSKFPTSATLNFASLLTCVQSRVERSLKSWQWRVNLISLWHC